MAPIERNVYFINTTSQQHQQHLFLLFPCLISFVQHSNRLDFSLSYLSISQQQQQLFLQSISANFPTLKQASKHQSSTYISSQFPIKQL
jgi:hypothetical protein